MGAGPTPTAWHELAPEEFRILQEMLYRACGILYSENRNSTLAIRVERRLRALALPAARHYIDLLREGRLPGELEQLIDEATTNETYFFRAQRHWDLFTQVVLPEGRKLVPAGGALRLWSAAAANGAEAYTAAILALESQLLCPNAMRIQILATDICSRILKAATAGLYGAKDLSQTPATIQRRYFTPAGDRMRIKPCVSGLVAFRRHNLMDPPPERGFHAVFLRNVLIYFDREAKERALRHVHDALVPGGFLFLGESESTVGVEHPFTYVEPSFYRR